VKLAQLFEFAPDHSGLPCAVVAAQPLAGPRRWRCQPVNERAVLTLHGIVECEYERVLRRAKKLLFSVDHLVSLYCAQRFPYFLPFLQTIRVPPNGSSRGTACWHPMHLSD